MQQTKRKRQIKLTVIVIVVGACIGIAIFLLRLRERLLTDVAHPVVPLDFNKQDVFWLYGSQLLIVTTEQSATDSAHQEGKSVSRSWQGSVEIFDADTGKRAPMTGLTNLLKRTTVSPLEAPDDFEISPDRRWVLWKCRTEGAQWSPLQAARWDGSQHREWSLDTYVEDFFLDDDHLVQMMDHDPVMMVRDLQNPTQDRKYATTARAKDTLIRYAAQRPRFTTVSVPDETEADGTAKIQTYRTEDRLQLLFNFRGKISEVPKPILAAQVKLPDSATMRMHELSPLQNAVFYDMVVAHLSPVSIRLHRIFPAYNAKPTFREEIWVCVVDGQGMREIGQVPTELDRDGNPKDPLFQIHWLPDGKHISFLYRGTLYVTPAEPER